ncbi:MAG: acetyltransferase [Negativicutes bacterium]|nr:acetyltransferase [Negativicutes bacterium]
MAIIERMYISRSNGEFRMVRSAVGGGVTDKRIVIVGAGGHGRVIAGVLRSQGMHVLGFVDPDPCIKGKMIDGMPILGGDDVLLDMNPGETFLVNAIGAVRDTVRRRAVGERLTKLGFAWVGCIHSRASVDSGAKLMGDVQIMAGAIIQGGTAVGAQVVVNTGAVVDHDCLVGGYCHIATGATLAGGVVLGRGVLVGAGAVIIQNIQVGENAVVAAGAVVVSNVSPGVMVAGVPAVIKKTLVGY